MVAWTHVVLVLNLLKLATLHESSKEDRGGSLKYVDTSAVVYFMENVSDVWQCFGESMMSSQRVNSDLLHESLRLQRENSNCSASLERISSAVTEANEYLKQQLTETKGQVESLTQEKKHLETELQEEKQRVDLVTEENGNLKQQLTETKGQVESLTQEKKLLETELQEEKKSIPIVSLLLADFEFHKGYGFYKYFPKSLAWAEAVEYCRARGTHLGIINSPEEASVYTSIIKRNPHSEDAGYPDNYHVGISDPRNTREFQTLDGVPLSELGYSKWEQFEPNNAPPQESCVSIHRNAKLNDVSCSLKLPYICEIEYP